MIESRCKREPSSLSSIAKRHNLDATREFPRLLSSQTLPPVMNSMLPSTTARAGGLKPGPLPPEQRKRRHVALGDATLARTISSSSRFQTEEKENAHLRSRRRAEQDEPSEQREHRRSGSHGGGFEERLKGEREEKRQRGRRKCGGSAANCSIFSFETVFLLLCICGYL